MSTQYIVRDNVFSPHLISAANAEWPANDWIHWHAYGYGESDGGDRGVEKPALKLASKDADRITPACSLLLQDMSRLKYLLLPPDAFPDFSLHGAGMHEIPDGGHLSRHLDSDSYSQRPTWRRAVSGVLYLNDDFDGGVFCLEADGTTIRIQPYRNRLVLFQSTDTAYHWVEKVTGGSRRTLAMFWWVIADSVSKRSKAQFMNTSQPGAANG